MVVRYSPAWATTRPMATARRTFNIGHTLMHARPTPGGRPPPGGQKRPASGRDRSHGSDLAPPAIGPGRPGRRGREGRAVPYNTGRIAHDADAHIMETPTWLGDHADPGISRRIAPLRYPGGNELRQTGDPAEQSRDLTASFDRLRAVHASDEYRSLEAQEIMARKNFAATGSFIAEDRPRALDLLGFSSQLVFNTFHNGRLRNWEHSGDLDLAYGTARAHNRAMVEFCSIDARLLPTCYVPLVDFD